MGMRVLSVLCGFMLIGAVSAKVDPVGVWKPGIKHAAKLTTKEAETVRTAKAMVQGGSLKVNKDKTFGMALAGEVMLGTWTFSGNILTINVKEIVGMSAEAVKKLPENKRVGKFKFTGDGLQMVTLPEPSANKPRVMWRKEKPKK